MNTTERWDDPVVLIREAIVGDKEQSQYSRYSIINVLLDIRVMVALQAFIE